MYGNVVNRIMEVPGAPDPAVGDGATETLWSDRRAYTVVDVHVFSTGARKGQVRAATVQRDNARNTAVFPAQHYTYTPNPDGEKVIVRKLSDGRWRSRGRRFAVGLRDEYEDPSF